ncbi:MAG: zinc ribbon domain-containing protein [Deltaproteobacteria bacterium]|nr:zinc ribbon domain-containing protein [Deltaproteobacteria bacterium]
MDTHPCPRCESPLYDSDLRCPVCALPCPPPAEAREGVKATIVRCGSCHAAVAYDVEVQAPRCAFCGSVTALEEREDPPEQPDGWLPFRVDDVRARAALTRWLSKNGFFRPNDLSRVATFDSLKPLWWVGWAFDAEALVSWSADSDAGHGRADWAPHAGQRSLQLDDIVVSASRGLDEREVAALARAYDLSSAEAEAHPMPGVVKETFDLSRSGARAVVARAIDSVAADHASSWVPGSRQRNLHVVAKISRLLTRRFAFPAHVLAYRYKDELYRVIVHGQDDAVVIGKKPVSWVKIVLVGLAVLGAAFLAFHLLSG